MTAKELAEAIAAWAVSCNTKVPDDFDKRMCRFTGGLMAILERVGDDYSDAIKDLIDPTKKAD